MGSRSRGPRWALAAIVVLSTAFDLERRSVPPGTIVAGGPPKDGIPALTSPTLVPAGEADFLRPDDRVIGVVREGVARAYPIRILNWHEVVNDSLGSTPIAVTWCPLTASAVVFDRVVEGREVTFGVSGRLYQSNVLLYDHQTESLWSQLGAGAVAGARTGARLRAMPSVETTWDAWRAAHPATLVLSVETGHRRDYGRDPYARHRVGPPLFPTGRLDARLRAKDRVLGVTVGDEALAFPLAALAHTPRVETRLGGVRLRMGYDVRTDTVHTIDADPPRPLGATVAYWFAWSAFHPATRIWSADGAAPTAAAGPRGRPSGTAAGAPGVTVVSHEAYWTDLPGTEPGPAGTLLVVRGELRNVSQRAVPHVRLVFELLDATGEVVATEQGYNAAAETLRPVDLPDGTLRPSGPTDVAPMAPGATDGFRMLFLREEVPAVARYRVRVVRP